MMQGQLKKLKHKLKTAFNTARKDFAQYLVRKISSETPAWSNLDHSVIEDVRKASVGCAVAPVFIEDGVPYVVLVQAGEHYSQTKGKPPAYMAPGGFINLEITEGSSHVKKSKDKGEGPKEGGVREIEEEFVSVDGFPLIPVDPERLIPMDMKTLSLRSGERIVATGTMFDLSADEVALLKPHIRKLQENDAYRKTVMNHTINKESGKPEIENLRIFKLSDVADGKVNLMHQDQRTLFQKVLHRVSERLEINDLIRDMKPYYPNGLPDWVDQRL